MSPTEALEKQVVSCLIVDEMGFLTELYSVADWAFVGGGFGAGIHSTIEPAIYGIPVAGGPQGAQKFSEIEELNASGQMSLISRSEDFILWLQGLQNLSQKKALWIEQASKRAGAAQKILATLEKF